MQQVRVIASWINTLLLTGALAFGILSVTRHASVVTPSASPATPAATSSASPKITAAVTTPSGTTEDGGSRSYSADD